MHDKCITHLSESKQVLGLEQWVKKGGNLELITRSTGTAVSFSPAHNEIGHCAGQHSS